MLRGSVVVLAVCVCLAGGAVAGCGSSSSSSGAAVSQSTSSTTTTIEHATAKFILHVGLAGGAFHRYIYKPFKAGSFSHPFSHKIALIKAALASLFIYHELKLAVQDAKSSKILAPLLAPVTALAAKLSALRGELAGGHANGSSIDAVQANGGQVIQSAGSQGIQIPDVPVSSPTGAGAPA
jgi:hypothetical protein